MVMAGPIKTEPQSNGLRIGLVGAGIGGLAAAIALKRAGARVMVLEAAANLGEACQNLNM